MEKELTVKEFEKYTSFTKSELRKEIKTGLKTLKTIRKKLDLIAKQLNEVQEEYFRTKDVVEKLEEIEKLK